MKKITTLLLILFNLSINAQEKFGYVMYESTFNYKDTMYDINSVSGMAFTFSKLIDDSTGTEYLVIGQVLKGGILYNNFEILEKIIEDSVGGYVMYIAIDAFGHFLGLKYNLKTFTITSKLNIRFKNSSEVWEKYYTGEFLDIKKE